jgi:hypothetical protein
MKGLPFTHIFLVCVSREGAKEEGGFGFKAHASGRALGDVCLFT